MLKPYHRKRKTEAGCDEAGRGCFAGPVSAAAVILPKNFYHPELNDSKQVTAEQRETLRVYIEKKALYYAVAMVDVALRMSITTTMVLFTSYRWSRAGESTVYKDGFVIAVNIVAIRFPQPLLL